LAHSWQLYRAAFGLLLGYAGWILLPYLGVAIMAAVLSPEQIFTDYLAVYVILIIAQGIITVWAGNAIILTVNAISEKQKIETKVIASKSWQLILPLVVVALLETLAVLGGFLLLFIPGIIFAVWFAFAQISVIVDDKRGVAALSFSRSLVVGRFFEIMRMIILGPLVIFIAYIMIISLLVGLGLLLSGDTDMVIEASQMPLWPDIIENIVNVFILPLFLVYWTLLYENVKETKVCNSSPSSDLKSTSN